jgi:hypothetical protein
MVSWAADGDAERSPAIEGSPGRYMSIDRGPKVESAPSSTTNRHPGGGPAPGPGPGATGSIAAGVRAATGRRR